MNLTPPIDCPALHALAEDYPERFGGLVPKRVRMLRSVGPDFPYRLEGQAKPQIAFRGIEYPAWTNSHGAVAVVFPDGSKLGVKPDEFAVAEWHDPFPTTPSPARAVPKALADQIPAGQVTSEDQIRDDRKDAAGGESI